LSATDIAARPVNLIRQNRTWMTFNAFAQLLWRDLWVTCHDWKSFLATSLMQPVFFLFIFGKLLPSLGQAVTGYSIVILPGIIALTTLLTAMTAVVIPLAVEFGYTKEIEDRLLSPLPIWGVAVAKLTYAAIRGIIAGMLIFPLGWLILGNAFQVSCEHLGLLIVISVLGAFSGAAIGLTLGTMVPPTKVGLVLPLVLPPLIFTGCVYYPWAQLHILRWFQVVTLFMPLTYTSEGFRAALAPNLPHLPTHFIVLGQLAVIAGFGYVGIRGFKRKALD
jgi:ABC-2 type transport system permease protein